MKLLRVVFLFTSLFSLSLFAQRGGGGHGGGGGGGFHGGGGGGGAIRGGGGYGGAYRGGYGGGYGGYGGYRGGYGYGRYGYGGWGWGFGLGFGWPYYGYGYGYPYGAYYDPYYYDYGYTYAPSAYITQPAVVTQTYAAPVTTTATTTGSYYRQPDYYLIAFNDHSIRAAQSYNVVGDQLEWTPKEGGAVQRAPLSSVDKTFTAQINRDRRVQITLP